MENAKINKDAAAEPKNETPIVSDKETRARLYEEDEAQARETLSKAEALFALADEMFRQTFEDLKRSRPQAEMANDPNSLLPHLLCMKVSFDSVDEILDANRRVLQSQTDLAEKFSVWAAAEIDPDTKRHYPGNGRSSESQGGHGKGKTSGTRKQKTTPLQRAGQPLGRHKRIDRHPGRKAAQRKGLK